MHKEYQDFINEKYLTGSPATRKHISDILVQLPPLVELTRSWILSFLSSKNSDFTKWNCFKTIRLVLDYYQRLDLLEGISIKQPKSTLKRSDLFNNEEISAILRA